MTRQRVQRYRPRWACVIPSSLSNLAQLQSETIFKLPAAMTQYSVLLLPTIALAMIILFPQSNRNSNVSVSWKSRRKRKIFLWRLTIVVLLVATFITLAWRWEGFVSLVQGMILCAAVLVPALIINTLTNWKFKSRRKEVVINSDLAEREGIITNNRTTTAHPTNANDRKLSSDPDLASNDIPPRKIKTINELEPESSENLAASQIAGQVAGKAASQAVTNRHAASRKNSNTTGSTTDSRTAKSADRAQTNQTGRSVPNQTTRRTSPAVNATTNTTPTSQPRVRRKNASSSAHANSLHESTALNPDFDDVEITLFKDELDSPAEVQDQLDRVSDAVQSHDFTDYKDSLSRDDDSWKEIRDNHDRQSALSTDLITTVTSSTDLSKLDSKEIKHLVTTLTKDKLRLQKLVIAQQAAIESERQSHDQSRTVARDAIKIMRDARNSQKYAEKIARRERTERKRIEQQYKSVATALDNALSIIEKRKNERELGRV